MATGIIGSPNMKILNSELNRIRFYAPQHPQGWRRVNSQRRGSIVPRQRSCRILAVTSGPSFGATEPINSVQEDDGKHFTDITSHLAPNVHEVESLLTELCSTTSIAEFELKVHGFRLYVARDLTGNARSVAAPRSTVSSRSESAVSNVVVEPDNSTNGAVSTTSLAIYKPAASERSIERLLNNSADEGLVTINSPRVGFFRRSRTIKGKRAPPPCKEKQVVKEGQVVCYIEQLGGEFPVESDVAGEVVKILWEDGEPIGYGDPLIVILPSFPGIEKLQ